MPQVCSVPSCSQKTGGHRFPADENLRKKWLKAIRRYDYIPTKHNVVCKKHFTKDDYQLPRDSVLQHPRPVLKKDVVPTRFSWNKSSYNKTGRSKNHIQEDMKWNCTQDEINKIKDEMPFLAMQCMEVEIEFEENDKKEIAIQCNLCECDNPKQQRKRQNH